MNCNGVYNAHSISYYVDSETLCAKATNFSDSIYLVVSSQLLRWSGTLVFGLSQTFPSLAM